MLRLKLNKTEQISVVSGLANQTLLLKSRKVLFSFHTTWGKIDCDSFGFCLSTINVQSHNRGTGLQLSTKLITIRNLSKQDAIK